MKHVSAYVDHTLHKWVHNKAYQARQSKTQYLLALLTDLLLVLETVKLAEPAVIHSATRYQLSTAVSVEMHERLRAIAHNCGLTISELVVMAINIRRTAEEVS